MDQEPDMAVLDLACMSGGVNLAQYRAEKSLRRSLNAATGGHLVVVHLPLCEHAFAIRTIYGKVQLTE
jgi:hypothetical protein